MKIVILDADTVTRGDIDLSCFSELGQVTRYGYTENGLVAERIGDADAVFCNKSQITSEVFDRCKNLKYIGLFATGFNNVDIDCAKENGVCVCNVPGYSTQAVAQHVFALILSFYNRVSDYNDTVKQGKWVKSKLFSYFDIPVYELMGRTIGIVGFGSIGKKVAIIAKAFDMNVLVHTRTVPKENTYGVDFVSLEKLLSESDIVTLHCPLNDKTAKLIDKKHIAVMKKTAVLINTSRGGVVNENDLACALNDGIIAGAGLDVVEKEPMEENSPLLDCRNCIITPHIAWAPYQTRERLVKKVIEYYKCWEDGNPVNTVI